MHFAIRFTISSRQIGFESREKNASEKCSVKRERAQRKTKNTSRFIFSFETWHQIEYNPFRNKKSIWPNIEWK